MRNENDIERAVFASELIEISARLTKRVNCASIPTTLDPSGFYCRRSGQPLNMRRATDDLTGALSMHGALFVETLLYDTASANNHPLWVRVDSETLDKLMRQDARGYACYCLRLLTDGAHKSPYVRKSLIIRSEIDANWALARAFQILGVLSQDAMLAFNEALHHALAYTREEYRFIAYELSRITGCTPNTMLHADDLAVLAVRGLLTPLLNRATQAALKSLEGYQQEIEPPRAKRKKFDAKPATPLEMAQGPSQIRGQKRVRNLVEIDHLIDTYGQFETVKNPSAVMAHTVDEFDELFKNDGFIAYHKPLLEKPGKSLLARMAQQKPAVEDENPFATLDFDALQFEETILQPLPEKPIVTVIPRSLLERHVEALHGTSRHFTSPTQITNTPKTTTAAPTKCVPKSSSLLARLAKKG